MKSKINRKKFVSFLAISFLVILGTFNLPFVYALHMQGDTATVYPDNDHLIQYGVFIPEPNMYATMSIDASNQGQYTMMNQYGGVYDTEKVDFLVEDISELYPWYFDDYLMNSTTDNDYIDPWMIDWINVTALNPHNTTLSPYSFNSVFNYYVLIEGGELTFPLNHSIPIQIDVVIESKGPKVLKADWLTDDPSKITQWVNLISPSGKEVGIYEETATSHAVTPSIDVFDYITFVAHETGTYRLLVYAEHDDGKPAYLNLKFLSSSIYSLPLEKLMFGGNGEDILTIEEKEYSTWQSDWYRINGEEGEIIRMELTEDYATGVKPIISIWSPCENGYVLDSPIGAGTHEIYFPTSGNAYVSFIDGDYGDWYRYSLYLRKYEVLNYNIGDNKTSIRISRSQSKTIEFSLEEDSFVRFNFTSLDDPAGEPYLDVLGTPNAFIFMDTKELDCYEIITPLESKLVGTKWFHYYYLPTGTYKGIIKNSNEADDGIFKISSNYVYFANTTIPINSLTYPSINPSEFLTLEFEPNDYYNGIYDAQYVYINITEPGQYLLNTTIYALDYLPALPLTADPSVVAVYNWSEGTTHDWTDEALNTSKSFPAFSDDWSEDLDLLFVAYPQKWHNIELNFSSFGSPSGPSIDFRVWDGSNLMVMPVTDGTSEFISNGTVVLDINSNEYRDWALGMGNWFELYGIDVPGINEDDYYWLGIWNWDSYSGNDVPYIQTIKLSNITLQGDINLALIRESGYNYSDSWNVPIGVEPSLLIYQESGNLYDSAGTMLLKPPGPYPRILGLEEGVYKLLIIPHGFGYSGSLKVDFAVENYWPYRHQRSYNISAISPTPNLYMYQIQNYTTSGYGQINITMHNYGLITQYNDTEASISVFPGNLSYFVVECYGSAYQWTQLIVSTNNVSSYNLYLMQDLPWVTNSPNMEVALLASASMPFINNTHEFGVHTDHFYLLFEVDELDDLVTFRIALSQYNTTVLTASSPVASYTPPTDSGPWILGLAIGIPVVAGIIVVVYILKRKGRILTKHPV